MEIAVCEIVKGESQYWGEIPELQGVWATHQTLEGCRRALREALSDWIALRGCLKSSYSWHSPALN